MPPPLYDVAYIVKSMSRLFPFASTHVPTDGAKSEAFALHGSMSSAFDCPVPVPRFVLLGAVTVLPLMTYFHAPDSIVALLNG